MPPEPLHILLVDDDEDYHIIIRDLLSDSGPPGYRLDWAADFDSALARLAQTHFDLYLLDYQLGAHNGIELLRRIFDQDRNATIIMLTGQTEKELDRLALMAGADDYLGKQDLDTQLLDRAIRYSLERKKSLNALRESESKYHGIFNLISDGLIVIDADGRFVEANPHACAMYGFSYNEFLALHWRNIVHPDHRPRLERLLTQVIGGQTMHIESLDVRKDGSIISTDVTAAAFDFQGCTHALTLVRNITQQKNDQQELAAHRTHLEELVTRRTKDLEMLLDFSRKIITTTDPAQLFCMVTKQAKDLLDLNCSTLIANTEDKMVFLVQDTVGFQKAIIGTDTFLGSGELASHVITCKYPATVLDYQDEAEFVVPREVSAQGLRSAICVPLMISNEVLGVLLGHTDNKRQFSDQDVAIYQNFANQAAIALKNVRETAEREKAQEKAAIMEERGRLARELHDSVSQSLYSVTLFAETARQMVASSEQERLTDCLEELKKGAQGALKELRLLVYDLRPSALKEEGLVGALKQRLEAVERRSGVKGYLLVEQEGQLPAHVEAGLYRIAQEALNNALKHSAASEVTVRLIFKREAVQLVINDNGIGFDLEEIRKHGAGLGLMSIRERAERLGGGVTFTSSTIEGTTVTVSVPIHVNEGVTRYA